MNIKHIDSTIIVLVEFDEIPFNRLLLDTSIELINSKFNFKSIEPAFKPDNQPILLCVLGSFEKPGGVGIINKVEIEHRKLVISVEGDTEFAESVLSKLGEIFSELNEYDDVKELHPVTQTYESVIIANLDFHALELIDTRIKDFVSGEFLSKADLNIAKAAMNHFSLKFRIDYILSEKDLKKYKITVAPKTFTLGPRDGTRIDDQAFISQAPLKTEVHKEILKTIEKMYQ